MKRRLVIAAAVLLAYCASYAILRLGDFYVRTTGIYQTANYRSETRHRIRVGRGPFIIMGPLSLIHLTHTPLVIVEELYWNRDRLGSYLRNGLD
jgi:hypothetical protein